MAGNKSKDTKIMGIVAPKSGGRGDNAMAKQVKGDRIDSRKEESKARSMDKRK
jgi:hypothetical protein